MIGVLDWGCDFAHPAFCNEDGSTRLLALWDQRDNDHASPENRWGYGRVLTRDDINRALRSADPYGSLHYDPSASGGRKGAHGTHVLDIAAGSGRGGGMPGVAPEADLVFVHLSRTTEVLSRGNLGDSATVLEALDFVFSTAGDRPCVVNMSVGAHGASHDGSTLLEQGIDRAVSLQSGRAATCSAGNYFKRRHHTQGHLGKDGEEVLPFIVPADDPTDSELEVWYPGIDRFTAVVVDPAGTELATVGPGQDSPLSSKGRVVGHIYHYTRRALNGDHHIDLFLKPRAPGGTWKLLLKGDFVKDGRYHAWIERDRGLQPKFLLADCVTDSTTGTLCNGKLSITVGAYDPHDGQGTLGGFSSAGPTRDGRIKPEIVAPGVRIRAARSAPPGEAPGACYTNKNGTSMAAPHVAGAIACMFEAAGVPLEICETRALLFASADRTPFADGVPDAPDLHRYGYGLLDIAAAERAARQWNRAGPDEDQVESAAGERDSDDPNTEQTGTTFQEQEGDVMETEHVDSSPDEWDEEDAEVEGIDMGPPAHDMDVAPPSSRVLSFREALNDVLETTPSMQTAEQLCRAALSAMGTTADRRFVPVGRPREVFDGPVQPGDLLERSAPAQGISYSAVVVSEEPETAADLLSRGVPVETAGPGMYVEVVEFPFGGGPARFVGRRLTDAWGRVLRAQTISHPAGTSLTASSPTALESVSEAIPSYSVGAPDLRARRFVAMPVHVEDWVANATGTGLVVRRVECRTEAELAAEVPWAPSEMSRLPVWRSAPASSPSPGRLQAALDLLVYHPSGSAGGTTLPRGRFPLAIICMGNHNAYESSGGSFVEVPSFQGYSGFAATTPTGRTGAYLQEALAQIGIVSVSVSTNAANLLNLLLETRARLVLTAIRAMQRLARTRGNRYFGKIDFSRVALIGHSRGGDAVLRAVQGVPRGVSVKALIQLAPTDITGLATGTAPSLPAGARPTTYVTRPMRTRARDRLFHFIIWGSRDGDVSGYGDVRAARFGGPFRHYDRSSSQRAFHFWHGGTHNRFNRFWTDAQEGPLVDLATGGLLSRADHEARTVEAVRSLLLFSLHSERSESQLLDGRRRTTVAVSLPITGMWKFGRRLRTIDQFDDVHPTRNTMGGRNTTPATGVFDEVTVANENPPNAGVRAFQIPHIDRALRYSPAAPIPGLRQPHWRATIPGQYRRFDGFDVLTFRVTKRYLPAALACTPPGCTPATRPLVRVRLIDAVGNDHAEAAAGVLTAMPPIRRLALGAGIDLTKYPYETWEVDLSRYSGIRLNNVRYVQLEIDTEPGQPIYVDTLSLVKRS